MTTNRRQSAVMAGLLLLLTVLPNAGCTPNSSPAPTKTPMTEQPVADPQTVLNQLAAEMKTRVDGLTQGVKTTNRSLTGNDSTVCGTPSGNRWPRQWSYDQRLFLTQPDTRPTARELAAQLTNSGWAQRTDLDNGTELILTLQKDGAVIGLNSGSTGGGLAVTSITACVNADGTIDRRPVA